MKTPSLYHPCRIDPDARTNVVERTRRAEGSRAAGLLRDPYDLAVEVAPEPGIDGQAPAEEPLDLLVRLPSAQETQPSEHAAGVGIDDEGRVSRGVEHDAVGGLGADARHRQERRA